ncbi:MAG: hypothetical protein AAGI27_03450, partial [Pseudomonadota bacterium]
VSGTPSPLIELSESGSFDIYVAPLGERTAIAGPFDIDLTLGDVVDIALFDTADPNVSIIEQLTTP